MGRKAINVADLFCGAGGTSTGVFRAAEAMGRSVRLSAVNHWERAIETHSANHPKAARFCQSLADLDPRKAVPGGKLDLLVASPECTHHSVARGGKPINDQSRSSAFQRTVHWIRGFPIVECVSADAWRAEEREFTNGADFPRRFVPTPWAREVAKWAVGLRLTDREPEEHRSVGQGTVTYSWFIHGFPDDRATIPFCIFDHMQGGEQGLGTMEAERRMYPTRETAITSLDYAVARWVRGFA